MQLLLIKWSESILDIPALVRVGYGGVPIPVVENKDDDVSSLEEQAQVSNSNCNDPLVMTQSLIQRENGQCMIQKLPPSDARVNSKNDWAVHAKDSDSDDMESEPLVVQASKLSRKDDRAATRGLENEQLAAAAEKGRETQYGISGGKDQTKQHGYVPCAELLERTDVLFKGITDTDTITIDDIHRSLHEIYGFKLGNVQKELVKKRLTELMNVAASSETPPTKHVASTVKPAAKKRSIRADDWSGSDTDDEDDMPRRSFQKVKCRQPIDVMRNGKRSRFAINTSTDEVTSAFARSTQSALRVNVEVVDLATSDDEVRPCRQQEQQLVIDAGKGATAKDSRASNKRAYNHVDLLRSDSDSSVSSALPSPALKQASNKRAYNHVDLLRSDSDSSVSSALPSPALKQAVFVKPTTKNHTNRKTGPWTDAEVDAVRQGIARFGIGNWRKIRDNSDGRLDRRTGMQIKDKHRQMVRSGQL
jgi:hypothetical protein